MHRGRRSTSIGSLSISVALGVLTLLGACSDSASGDEKTNDAGVSTFIAIHMEVHPSQGVLPKDTKHPQEMWPTLGELVASADRHRVRLTLEFNPQWATYILADQGRLGTLRSWETTGHEIALHHHGPSHGDWNGYTDRTDKTSDSRYIGTIPQMMALMRKLPAGGKILSGGITNETTDWPEGVVYDTNGGTEKRDLLSQPARIVYNGHSVTQLRYRMYATKNKEAAALNEIEAGFDQVGNGTYMGIVFHCFDYHAGERTAAIDALFASLDKHGVSTVATSTLMSKIDPQTLSSVDLGVAPDGSAPYCGDGICGPVEAKGGFCPQDCKDAGT